MSRVNIDRSKLDDQIRRALMPRARQALLIYRAQRLKRDDPAYPFYRNKSQRSIRDPASSSITPIPGGIRITIAAKGAPFIEFGNDDGGDREYIHGRPLLVIPLKRGRKRSGAGSIAVVNGRPTLVIERVRTYSGRHLLQRSVRQAFGIRAVSVRG